MATAWGDLTNALGASFKMPKAPKAPVYNDSEQFDMDAAQMYHAQAQQHKHALNNLAGQFIGTTTTTGSSGSYTAVTPAMWQQLSPTSVEKEPDTNKIGLACSLVMLVSQYGAERTKRLICASIQSLFKADYNQNLINEIGEAVDSINKAFEPSSGDDSVDKLVAEESEKLKGA